MIPDIVEVNFPKKNGKQYASLNQATVNISDMGEKTITAQVKIDGEISPDFSFDWEVMFQGEKYIMPLRKPQGAKENTSLKSTIDLTFQHWAIYELKRNYFVEITSTESGTAIADKYIAPLGLTLENFIIALNKVLNYYYGGKIRAELYAGWEASEEPVMVSISYTYIWDLLVKVYELYAVRWQIVTDTDGNCVIKFDFPTMEIDHIFEYGYNGGLLKIERQVQSPNIKNILLGRGGEKNLPYRYFKNTDPDNDSFPADPDWVPELANIYFTELRDAAFRSYVQGWKAKHYGGTVTKSQSAVAWAYQRGYTDNTFQPVEYVKDDESITSYGPLWGALENNEDIYPTIQGVTITPYGRIDEVVAVEKIMSDDIEEDSESEAQIDNIGGIPERAMYLMPGKEKIITVKGASFEVKQGMHANLLPSPTMYKGLFIKTGQKSEDLTNYVLVDTIIKVRKASTGEVVPASGLPTGSYFYQATYTITNNHPSKRLHISVSVSGAKLESAELSDKKFSGTWNIWVKNLWGTSKNAGETDGEYAERVWLPILGGADGNEAKVIFSDGLLGISEDYEFVIPEGALPVYDTSKEYKGITSHWRISLAKSDAELDATGLYLPNTKINAEAGNHFFLIGIDLPYMYYAEAEKRLTAYKQDELAKVSDIRPTWVVSLDRVRMVNKQEDEVEELINSIQAGASLRLSDKRFITIKNENGQVEPTSPETLYVQSVTYTYREPTSQDAALIPDIEVVLSDKYSVTANPVSQLQGDVEEIRKQIGSLSNVEQSVRAVGDKIYLRKDGISDRSYSPTKFFSLLTSGDFRNGMLGGAGWGFYKDANGNWVLETDKVNVRKELQANTLVINQIETRGGMIVESAANIEVSDVEETDNTYICYFDTKSGTLANLFHLNDVAFCQRFTPENGKLKFYKRRVMAVGDDSITLTKGYAPVTLDDGTTDTGVNGTGVPSAGDIIAHFGNYIDKTRQYVKVRDVIDGGYERYIEGLYSVNSDGTEYYFVGRQYDMYGGKPRWFIGDPSGEYAEWINGKLNIKGSLSIGSTIGDLTFEEYIQQVSPPVEQEDIEQFVENIVNPKIDGIQDQIDGVIETWFYNGVPTLTNYPATEWNTEALKIQHLGDLYYDNDTGTAYRFSKNEQGTYYWNVITDDAITKALSAAQNAQDTADSKRRVFTSQPTTQQVYDAGDLWVNATYGTQYSNDILRCITHKNAGIAFNIAHWTLASKYTDDAALNTFIAGYQTTINGLKEQIDGKIETWYFAYDPSLTNKPASDWNTSDDKAAHAGDLFYNTTTKKVFRWTGAAWESMTDPDIQAALDAASDAQDTADNKRRVFMATPTVPYDKGDLWIDNVTNGKTLKVCITAKASGTFVGSDWAVADDASLNAFSTTITNTLNGIKDQIDQKAETWYQSTDPSTLWTTAAQKAEHKGDLWYNTTNGTTWYWNGSAWQAQEVPDSVFDAIDGKADIYVSKPTSYHKNDLWFLEADYTLSGVAYKQGTLVVAKNNMGAAWSANDWTKKDRYTDDSALDAFKTAYQQTINTINQQIDKKAETWYQATDPAANWTTAAQKSEHEGDLWYNTTTGKTYYYNGTAWQYQDIPQEVFDKIDGKASIFASKPTSYRKNDLWILEAAYTLSGTAYTKGELVTATADSNTFNAAHWTKKVKYTDDTVANQAKTQINNLSSTVNSLNSTVAGLKNFTDTAFSDGIIDFSEASAIQTYLKNIETAQKEVQRAYASLDANTLLPSANKTALANAKAAFDSAANALVVKITEVIADNVATSEERAAVNSLYTTFNTKYGDFVYALNQANSAIMAGLNANIHKLDYIQAAMKELTTIQNGLILSSVVSLGVNNSDYTTQTTYSGISGIYDNSKLGGGIAAWYGGDMIDKFYYYNSQTGDFNIPSGTRPAKGLDRMDGTGYRANGNLWWDANGVVHADPLSFFVGENTVGGLLASFQVVLQADGKHPDYLIPKVPFQDLGIANLLSVGNALKIGNGYLKWDDANKGFYVEDANGDLVGLYGGWLSAKGASSLSGDGGGGGTSYDRLDNWADYDSNKAGYVLSAKLGNDLNTRLSAVETGGATSITTTGSGNAITAINKSGNVITATKGATFLTAHQSLAAYLKIDGSNGTAAGVSALINKLSIGNATPTSSDYYVCQYAGGGTTTNSYHRRPISSLWQYMKNNADGIYASITSLNDYVTKSTEQTITGLKKFSSVIHTSNTAGTWPIGTKSAAIMFNGLQPIYATGQVSYFYSIKSSDGYVLAFGGLKNNIGFYSYSSSNSVQSNLLCNTQTGAWSTNKPFTATSFVKSDGTASQFLKANGSVDSTSYLSVTTASSTYIKKSGDTMTGNLTLPQLNIKGTASSNAYLTSNTATNAYLTAGGKIMMVWEDTTIRSGTTEAGTIDLGSASYRWNNVYAKNINVSSNTLVSNLNADLLDSYHETSFVRSWWTGNPGYNCDTYNTRPLINFTYANNAPFTGAFIDIVANGYGFYLGTTYHTDSPLYYRRHGLSSSDQMGNWQQLARIGDNVASATKLHTARTIWGQSFDGTADITGGLSNVSYIQNSATEAPYIKSLSSTPTNAGNLGRAVGFGTAATLYGLFVWGDGNGKGHIQVGRKDGTATAYHLALQEFGGNVGIGTASPSEKLHVVGTIFSTVGMYSNGYVSAKGQNTTSDIRLKQKIRDIQLSVSDIANAPVFEFAWKDGTSGAAVGTSAQYWRNVLPMAVSNRKDGFLSLAYGNTALACAVALARNMETLEQRVHRLEIENTKLKTQIQALQNGRN